MGKGRDRLPRSRVQIRDSEKKLKKGGVNDDPA